MAEKTITIELSESEARGYLPESSGTVSWATKANADAKLRAALAPFDSSTQEGE